MVPPSHFIGAETRDGACEEESRMLCFQVQVCGPSEGARRGVGVAPGPERR
jgi:hypothetical protein